MNDISHDRTANDVRSEYRTLSEIELGKIREIKDIGQHFINTLKTFPSSRENSLAITKIEEAVMWATKGATS